MGNFFWIALLLMTEIILLAVAYVQFKGDLASPSIITLLVFLVSTVCALYGVGDWKNVVFTGKAYALFALSFTLMIMTESFFAKYAIKLRRQSNKQYLKSLKGESVVLGIKKPWNSLLLAFLLFCTLIYIYRVYRSGISLGAGGLLSSIGYNKEEGIYDSIARLMFNIVRFSSYIYVVILSNNVMICKQKLRNNLDCVIIISLTILIAFFSGQRGVAIGYVLRVVVAFLISANVATKVRGDISVKKIIRTAVPIGILIIIVFYFSHSVVKGRSNQLAFVEYLVYYFGSTTALMGSIVEDPSLCHHPFVGYFGEKTFMGFWSTMYSWGLVSYPPAERRWISLGSSISSRAGNEFTYFCGPYIDFGFWGTLIFIVILYAFISNIYYNKILRRENNVNRFATLAIYLYIYGIVTISFYQDTIRSLSRPINLLYLVYIYMFCKLWLGVKTQNVITIYKDK